MIPYFMLLFIAFIFCYIARYGKSHMVIGNGDYTFKHNLGIPAFFTFLWLLLACKSTMVGYDTQVYEKYFYRFSNQTLNQILTNKTEVLYGILNWLVGKFTDDFQVFQAIVASIIIIPIAMLYAEDRRHSYLKIVLFVNMSIFVMMFSGIRQSIAISIGCIAFYFVRRKKLLAFFITVIIAMGFHESAFMLIVMYPLYYIRLERKHLFIIIPAVLFVFKFNKPIFVVLLKILEFFGSKYQTDSYSETGAFTTLFMFMLFMIFAYLLPKNTKIDSEFIGLRNYLLLAVFLQCFAPLHTLAMRMNYYYILFIPVIIPKVLEVVDNKRHNIAQFAEILMCIFFTIYYIVTIVSSLKTGGVLGTVPYIPFWRS